MWPMYTATSELYGLSELECVCRGCETATLSVDWLLGNSFKTPNTSRPTFRQSHGTLGVANELPSSRSTDSVAVSQP